MEHLQTQLRPPGEKDKAAVKVRRAAFGVVLVLVALSSSVLGYFAGGYYVGEWGLVAIIFAALLAVAAVSGLLGGSRSRWSVVATTLLISYSAWTFLSILWSPNRGDAWYGSCLTLLYLLAFWTATTLVALEGSRRWALSALAIGPGIVAALTVPRLGTDEQDLFLDGRLLGSFGYFNAEAAFLLMALWAGVYVAGSSRMHPAVRSAALASAVLCTEVAVLTQSRGAMVALAVSLPVFLLFSGNRLRGLISLLPVAVALVISFPYLNEVFLRTLDSGSGAVAIAGATPVIWSTTAVGGAYGLVWSLLDSRWRPSASLHRVAGATSLVLVAMVIVACGWLFVDRVGSPASWLEEKWVAFKTDDLSGQEDSRYLSASGSGRYALWQVAWRDFAENPGLGVGTHNYEATYYQDREKVLSPLRQPHSLPLEVLAERGVFGGILFFGFLGICVFAGLWRRSRDLNSEGKTQVAVLLAITAYWFTHSSAEWFWQIPAVTIPAMICLAMLVAPWKRIGDDERVYAPSDRPLRFAGVGLLVLTLVTTSPLLISDHYRKAAENSDNPWMALRDIERARVFNPLDSVLAREQGDLAFQIGDIPRATSSYADSVYLNPEHYSPYAVLGGAYDQVGQTDRALRLYRKALELNPLEESLRARVDTLEEQQTSGE